MLDPEKLIQKLALAKAKVMVTVHNDSMPSARLIAAIGIIGQVIDELRGVEAKPEADRA